MRIEWNKVTWYSKLFALLLFVTLPPIGFYLGVQYGKVRGELRHVQLELLYQKLSSPRYNEAPVRFPSSVTPSPEISFATVDTSNWKTYRNEKYGFEVKYPPRLSLGLDNYSSDFDENTSKEGFVLYNPTIEPSYCHTNAANVTDCYNDGFGFGIYSNDQKDKIIQRIQNSQTNNENNSTFTQGTYNGAHYYLGTLIGPSYVTSFFMDKLFFLIYYGNERDGEGGDYDQETLESILFTLKFTK